MTIGDHVTQYDLFCSPFLHSRIRKISGLQTLLKLDVLDLHGNMVG